MRLMRLKTHERGRSDLPLEIYRIGEVPRACLLMWYVCRSFLPCEVPAFDHEQSRTPKQFVLLPCQVVGCSVSFPLILLFYPSGTSQAAT